MAELTLKQQEIRMVKQLAEFAIEEFMKCPDKCGILLCEGNYDSIDFAVYSLAYPELLVVPCEGCTVVTKMVSKVLWRLKGKTEAKVFAILVGLLSEPIEYAKTSTKVSIVTSPRKLFRSIMSLI